MKLFHSETSPYVRKVMLVLHHTGLIDKVELVPGSGTPLAPNPETKAANPLGKVPCLLTDAGEAVFDSRVICQYLDALAGAGLYPEGAARAGVLTREALCDGILDASILAVYETRLRPENLIFQPWIDAQLEKVRAAVTVLENHAGALEGPLTADQIAAGAALGYLDLRFPDLGWRESAPQLAAWFERFAATPEMQATVPKP